MKAKTIEKITGKQLKEVANELYYDMQGCSASSKALSRITLPDGREAEISVNIEADEDNFVL